MAVLGATSLTGCTSIPSFIGSGSKMVFRMATTPVSWTKDTTVNEGSLRVVNGSASPGGSITWSQCFATRPFGGAIGQAADGCSVQPATVTVTMTQSSATEAQTGLTALQESQINGHNHVCNMNPGNLSFGPGTGVLYAARVLIQWQSTGPSPAGGGQHRHAVVSQHTHPFPANSPHTHTISGDHGHTGNFGSVDFNLTYVDMIIASKDA